jgi:hypothetical protein
MGMLAESSTSSLQYHMTRTCTHAYAHTQNARTHVHTYTHTHTHTHVRTHAHTRTHTRTGLADYLVNRTLTMLRATSYRTPGDRYGARFPTTLHSQGVPLSFTHLLRVKCCRGCDPTALLSVAHSLVPVDAVNSVQTLKASRGSNCTCFWLTMNPATNPELCHPILKGKQRQQLVLFQSTFQSRRWTGATTTASLHPSWQSRQKKGDRPLHLCAVRSLDGIYTNGSGPLGSRVLDGIYTNGSRPLSFTPLIRLKRSHACDQGHTSWVFTPVTG